jgi:hypothetical protein
LADGLLFEQRLLVEAARAGEAVLGVLDVQLVAADGSAVGARRLLLGLLGDDLG